MNNHTQAIGTRAGGQLAMGRGRQEGFLEVVTQM
jgi:hypothetical protein